MKRCVEVSHEQHGVRGNNLWLNPREEAAGVAGAGDLGRHLQWSDLHLGVFAAR